MFDMSPFDNGFVDGMVVFEEMFEIIYTYKTDFYA